jgi:hypothetical protein
MIENFKLKVFRVVADNLNYRRAADELHITQPAVTAQIRSLEESLGIALFDRVGRETSLTSAGTTLLQYVRQIETITNSLKAQAKLLPDEASLLYYSTYNTREFPGTKLWPQRWPEVQTKTLERFFQKEIYWLSYR